MIKNRSLSDQLYKWSDSARQINFFVTPPSQDIIGPTAAPGAGTARLTHRTLQALWQTQLQMRKRPWPRPQTLPFSQSHRYTSRDGLRSSGIQRPSDPISRQSPADSHNPRRGECHQSRIAAPPRGFLSHDGERLKRCAYRDSQPTTRQHPHCQYARSVARPRVPNLCQQGGES